MQHRRRSPSTAIALAVAVLAVAAGCGGDASPSPRGGPTSAGSVPALTDASSASPGTGPRPVDGDPRVAADPSADPPPGATADIGARTVARSPSGRVRVETLSTRASMVTGGDVRVALDWPGTSGSTRIAVALDGHDVLSQFPQDANEDGRFSGVVTGVADRSTLVASFGDDPADRVELELHNHPIGGPVFSGPQLEPFVCATVEFGLGPAVDADCNAATRYRWYYVGRDQQIHDVGDPRRPPSDVATATVNGTQVPFFVREEKGVINRSNYVIYALDTTPALQLHGTLGFREWNRRLVYRFGGGCGSQFGQGASRTNAFDLDLLSKGYAVTTSSLNTFQTSCNSVVSAETAMMVKEHFIEQLGVPVFTIGDGGSGGAIQQLQIAQNYPGLLDGITPSLPFPDLVSLLPSVTDCGLLQRYWSTAAGAALSDAKRAAIEGFVSTRTCTNWNDAFLGVIDPRDGCDPSLASKVYDAKARPKGVRCTFQDSNVNLYGRDPVTGFARRPLDNVGVEYGRNALAAGTITVDEFLDLNERIGGFDADGMIVAQRTRADEDAVTTAYASGQVVEGGGLLRTPIILRNLYTDPLGDIHDRFRSFSLRDRLRAAGAADDVVLWSFANTNPDLNAALAGENSLGDEPVFVMDEWLTTGRRPAKAHDRCVVNGQEIVQADGAPSIYEAGPCHDAFPVHGDTRTAAGAPRRNDILKCALRSVDPSAYGVPFTDAEAARLRAVFRDGVCDWTQPGAGQVPLGPPWPTLG